MLVRKARIARLEAERNGPCLTQPVGQGLLLIAQWRGETCR